MVPIFAVIIGSEILNGRRVDKHFEFLHHELALRGLELSGSFVVKDDKALLEATFSLVKDFKDAVMFSFGGIGSTPDDLTRQISAKVFTDDDLKLHKGAKNIIEDEFGDEAYPYRINMAYLPKGAKLLTNVVNRVPGYFLEDRFFFMPGFPNMAHPMAKEALDNHIKVEKREYFSFQVKVEAREGDLVGFMEELPDAIELSSLPQMRDGRYAVEIMLRSFDESLIVVWSEKLQTLLRNKNISFKIL